MSQHFATHLQQQMHRHRLSRAELLRVLRTDWGILCTRHDVREWLAGDGCAQWDKVVPALAFMFGTTKEEWFDGQDH